MHVENPQKKIRYGWGNGKTVPEDRCPVTPCVHHVPAKDSDIRPHNPIQTQDSVWE